MKLVKLFFMASILLATTLASAGSITYTESAIISGSLGQNQIQGALMTMRWVADAANAQCDNGYCMNTAGSNVVNVNIGGYGTFLFTGNISVHDYQKGNRFPYSAAGFECTGCGASIVDTKSESFSIYDLITDIGPITGDSYINTPAIFDTTGGVLDILSAGESTFTARLGATPEPSSLLLMATGAISVLATVRRNWC